MRFGIAFGLILAIAQFCVCTTFALAIDEENTPAMRNLYARIAADPRNAQLYFQRAELYMTYMDYDAGIADATRSISPKPSEQAYFLRGQAYRGVGKSEKAEADFEQATALNPQGQNSFAELAIVALRLKHYDKAEKAFAQLFKLNPGRSVERFRRAQMYHAMHKNKEALADLQHCLKTDSDGGGRNHELLGKIYMELKQYPEAVKAFDFAISKNMYLLDARKARADALDGLGKHDLAKQERKKLDDEFGEAFRDAPFRSRDKEIRN